MAPQRVGKGRREIGEEPGLVETGLVLIERRADNGGRDDTLIQWVRGHAGHPLNEAAGTFGTRAADAGRGRRVVSGPGWTLL